MQESRAALRRRMTTTWTSAEVTMTKTKMADRKWLMSPLWMSSMTSEIHVRPRIKTKVRRTEESGNRTSLNRSGKQTGGPRVGKMNSKGAAIDATERPCS